MLVYMVYGIVLLIDRIATGVSNSFCGTDRLFLVDPFTVPEVKSSAPLNGLHLEYISGTSRVHLGR